MKRIQNSCPRPSRGASLMERQKGLIATRYVRNTPSILVLCVLTCVLFSSCERPAERKAVYQSTLDSLKQSYAPDHRTAVFDLTVEQGATGIVVKGEVDNPQAKEGSLAALAKAAGAPLVDSIRVLPDPGLGVHRFGIVSVSVGNVRTTPDHASELCTQTMMGMVLRLLKKEDGWYFVQLPDKYLGWFEAKSMKVTTAEGVDAWRSSGKAIVTAYFSVVRATPSSKGLPVSDAVMGDVLQKLTHNGNWVGVELPDGRRGYLETGNVEDFERWKAERRLTPGDIEKTAKLFIGVPYLWGGTSPKGMDCSGFTKTVFRLNGMELNRDADEQAQMGEPVELGENFRNLKKGDLLFFGRKATANKSERISHVGIYLENGEYIHSPGGAGVRLNSFDPSAPDFSRYERDRFVRARRLIGTKQVSELPQH